MLEVRLEAYVELAIRITVFLRDDLGTGRSHDVNVRYQVYGLYAIMWDMFCRRMEPSIPSSSTKYRESRHLTISRTSINACCYCRK